MSRTTSARPHNSVSKGWKGRDGTIKSIDPKLDIPCSGMFHGRIIGTVRGKTYVRNMQSRFQPSLRAQASSAYQFSQTSTCSSSQTQKLQKRRRNMWAQHHNQLQSSSMQSPLSYVSYRLPSHSQAIEQGRTAMNLTSWKLRQIWKNLTTWILVKNQLDLLSVIQHPEMLSVWGTRIVLQEAHRCWGFTSLANPQNH